MFDTVNIESLIAKLKSVGVHCPMLMLFSTYLLGRTQQVKIDNFLSNTYNMISGEPQGGHLYPLLFVIFINELKGTFLFCIFLLFANDLKLYARVNTINDRLLIQKNMSIQEHGCMRIV